MKTKVFSIAIVLVLLMMALSQVSDVVHDREFHRQATVRSVARSLAGAQTLLGPLVHMSCSEEWDVKTDNNTRTERREFMLAAAPATLTLQGDAQLEPRSRGLHTTQVFTLKATLAAQWPDLSALRPVRTQAGSRLNCGPMLMMLAVSDARGIRRAAAQAGGQTLPLKPGTFHGHYPRGVHAVLPADTDLAAPLSARLDLELLGTQQVSVVPLGGATEVRLASAWPHPSFGGLYLPADRSISDSGFDATWRVSALASTAQAAVLGHKPLCATEIAEDRVDGGAPNNCVETFGVRFIDPGDNYALSDRATKYGLLFIGLTFLAVGLFEFMKAVRVHPIQYLLVGAALSLFFLLLVSLSEHLSFSVAYALAASACVLLLGFYASHMLHSWQRGAPLGAGVALLYGLLFVLLQLEQTALVVGSVALFVVLALVMTLTRRVDWYRQMQRWSGRAARPEPQPGETGEPQA